jgi:iron complex outermembrane receptor protein
MSSTRRLSLAARLAASLGALACLATPPACGQDALTPDVQRIEKIVVTGSRIAVSENLASPSPITEVTAADIKLSGFTSVEEVVNRLPQAYADQGSNVSNGSTGTAAINLRHLGATRTLVLIDGRRLPPGSPLYWATDVSNIPAPLVQRVEVLTGGATAVYGSDAVAGVVNFIMNDHFEGLQLQYNGNGYNHQQHNAFASVVAAAAAVNPQQFQVPGDVGLTGVVNDFNALAGGNFANGKGNAALYFEYRHQAPVLQSQYDYSACQAAADTPNATAYSCGGSATAYPARFIDGNTGRSWTIADAEGNLQPWSKAGRFNYAPYNYYQTNNERYLANAFVHYDLLDQVRLYGEFDFSDVRTVAQIAPSGTFLNEFALYDRNPLLTPAFKEAFGITPTTPGDVYIGRRNAEGGGRQDQLRYTDYRYVFGARGDLLDGKWGYDLWWQSGKVIYQESYQRDFSYLRAKRALDVVTDPRTGRPVCASALDGSDPQCVPYDIFHTPGGVTQAALDYLQVPAFQNGYTEQSVLGFHLTSDLGAAYGWKSPWAVDGVGVAFGIERRTDKLGLQTDAEFASGDLMGQGGAIIGLSGQYTVVEAYAEVRAPLVERKPWAYLLNVSGSYRYSDYTTLHQTTNSFGLGAQWAPVRGYMLRGSYQQASRAPNVVELFTVQSPGLFYMNYDPCGPNGTATLEQCLRTGLKPSQYKDPLLDPAGGAFPTFNAVTGGNPALAPETAKSRTAGIVLTPLPTLNATLDYWSIDVHGVLGTLPPEFTLDQCLAVGQFYCSLVHRDDRGTLWRPGGGGYVSGINLNLGGLKTSGWDVAVNAAQDLPAGWGRLLFSFVGTYVDQFVTTPIPGLGSYDCAGLFGATCGIAMPRWRDTLRATWSTPWSADLAVTWRYYGATSLDCTSDNPMLSCSYAPVDARIPSRSYFDLAVSWNVAKNWTVRAGVNNVLDRDPPINSVVGPANFGNGNGFPGMYDSMGRNFFVGVTAKF